MKTDRVTFPLSIGPTMDSTLLQSLSLSLSQCTYSACAPSVVRFLYFFCLWYLSSPNVWLSPSGTYNPYPRGTDACRRRNRLWSRTLDRYTRAGLPEFVSAQCHSHCQRQHRTEHIGHTLSPRIDIKIELDPPGWKAGTPLTKSRLPDSYSLHSNNLHKFMLCNKKEISFRNIINFNNVCHLLICVFSTQFQS